LVPGGGFKRNNDPLTPALVSDYQLDKYEVTVGRFRRFLTNYDSWRAANHPAAAEGAHEFIPGTGWVPGWALPADRMAFESAIKCDGDLLWTAAPGPNETRPMNCLDWFQASAFCAWDGGRLPTEAEWENAATGGAEQRLYPWGNTVPGQNGALAAHSCLFNAQPGCQPLDIALVGAIPGGNGRFGHADLAGSMREWVYDWFSSGYPNPCTDCADTTPTSAKITRGASWSGAPEYLLAAQRDSTLPETSAEDIGVRCARKGTDEIPLGGLVLWVSPQSVVKDQANKITSLIDLAPSPVADNLTAFPGREPTYVDGAVPSIRFANTLVKGPPSESFNFSTGVTIAFWIKRDPAMTLSREVFLLRDIESTAYPFLSIRSAGSGDSDLEFSYGPVTRGYYSATSKGVWPANTWQHFAWVYNGVASTDSTRVQLYVNGSKNLDLLSAFPPQMDPLNHQTLRIGGETDADNSAMVADLGDFVVYNRALSPSEVLRVYGYHQHAN